MILRHIDSPTVWDFLISIWDKKSAAFNVTNLPETIIRLLRNTSFKETEDRSFFHNADKGLVAEAFIKAVEHYLANPPSRICIAQQLADFTGVTGLDVETQKLVNTFSDKVTFTAFGNGVTIDGAPASAPSTTTSSASIMRSLSRAPAVQPTPQATEPAQQDFAVMAGLTGNHSNGSYTLNQVGYRGTTRVDAPLTRGPVRMAGLESGNFSNVNVSVTQTLFSIGGPSPKPAQQEESSSTNSPDFN